jgi:putative membrane protein
LAARHKQTLVVKTMAKSPYDDVPPDSLILRDYLAVDRTQLANERTFLAYVRTALGVAITGVSLVKFGGSAAWEIAGWSLLPIALVTAVIGVFRFRAMASRLAACSEEPPCPSPRTDEKSQDAGPV